MNNRFCTRCGSPLNEDGTCPHCDAPYSVDSIFDEPRVFDSTYDAAGSGFPASSEPVDYAEEVPQAEEYPAVDTVNYEYAEEQPQPDYASYAAPQSVPNDTPRYEERGGTAYTEPQQPSAPKRKSGGAGGAVKNWIDCAISFFKADPFGAVDSVLRGETHLWAIFAGLNVVFGAFCIAGMFGNGFVWLIDKVFGSYAMLISFYKEYTFGNLFVLFLFSLLMLALLFCAVTGCEYALFSLSQKKPRIEKLVRIVAISFFPMTIACAAAYIFSFFLMRVAAAIVFAGAVASFRLLNETVRREEGELPFWNVVLCNAAQVVATMIIVSIALAVI